MNKIQEVEIAKMCIEWELLSRKRNPLTNRKIKKNGPTYKKIEKQCKKTTDVFLPKKQKIKKTTTGFDINEEFFYSLPPDEFFYSLPPDEFSNTPNDGCVCRVRTTADVHTQTDDGFLTTYNTTNNYTNLKTRIQKANEVSTYLNNTVTIADQQWCISGPDKQVFNTYIEFFQVLANGTFGVVSKVMFKNLYTPVIIKEAKFMELDFEKLTTKKIEGRFAFQKTGKKNYFSVENIMLEAIDRLILQQHVSPNFLLFYETTWCKNCNMVTSYRRFDPGSCYLTFMEAADSDLYTTELPYIYQQESVLYQILLGLHALQKYLGMWHRDIKSDNIFIKRVEPGGVLKYIVDNETYYVQNEGFIAYVSDFNVADCLKPGVLTKTYEEYIDYDKYHHPIQVKYINKQAVGIPLKNEFNKKSKWTNSKNDHVDLVPNPVSLQEMHRDPIQFPYINFFGDIQDVIRMFIGGERAQIDQLHITIKPELPEMYARLINADAYAIKLPCVTTKCVKYLLAKEMLKTLYRPPPKNSGKFYIIEEFTL